MLAPLTFFQFFQFLAEPTLASFYPSGWEQLVVPTSFNLGEVVRKQLYYRWWWAEGLSFILYGIPEPGTKQ